MKIIWSILGIIIIISMIMLYTPIFTQRRTVQPASVTVTDTTPTSDTGTNTEGDTTPPTTNTLTPSDTMPQDEPVPEL